MKLGTKQVSKIDLVCKLFHARTQVHIFHLQTKSYAQHKALDDLYNELLEYADSLAEAFQKDGILKGYKSYPYEEGIEPVNWITKFREELNMCRKDFEPHIDNELQSLILFLDQTIYKLKFLS